MTLRIKLIIMALLIVLISFGHNKDKSSYIEKIGKYQDKTGELIISLNLSDGDTIQGEHCFVVSDGNKIDCCDEGISIQIYLVKDSNYEGYLKSFYDDNIYKIQVSFIEDCFTLLFIDDIHPFIPKSIIFHKIAKE